MVRTSKKMIDDNYFMWLGDPETGRWVSIDEYNEAVLCFRRLGFSSLDSYFKDRAKKERIDVV